MPHKRFDDLTTQVDASHQSRQCTVYAGSPEPANNQRQRAHVFSTSRLQFIEQVLNAGGRRLTANQLSDITSFAILRLISITENSERRRDHSSRVIPCIQQRRQRTCHTLITELAQQVDRRIAQQFVFQKRRHSWRDAGIANLYESVQRRKAQEEMS